MTTYVVCYPVMVGDLFADFRWLPPDSGARWRSAVFEHDEMRVRLVDLTRPIELRNNHFRIIEVTEEVMNMLLKMAEQDDGNAAVVDTVYELWLMQAELEMVYGV